MDIRNSYLRYGIIDRLGLGPEGALAACFVQAMHKDETKMRVVIFFLRVLYTTFDGRWRLSFLLFWLRVEQLTKFDASVATCNLHLMNLVQLVKESWSGSGCPTFRFEIIHHSGHRSVSGRKLKDVNKSGGEE